MTAANKWTQRCVLFSPQKMVGVRVPLTCVPVRKWQHHLLGFCSAHWVRLRKSLFHIALQSTEKVALKQIFFPHPHLFFLTPICSYKLFAWKRKWWELHIKAGSCQALPRHRPGRRGWKVPTRSLEVSQTPFLAPFLLQNFWARVYFLPHLSPKDCVFLANLRHFSTCWSVAWQKTIPWLHGIDNPSIGQGTNSECGEGHGEGHLPTVKWAPQHYTIQQAENRKDTQLGDVSARKACPIGRAFILTKSAETPCTHPQGFNITSASVSTLRKFLLGKMKKKTCSASINTSPSVIDVTYKGREKGLCKEAPWI